MQMLSECQIVDGGSLISPTRSGAVAAVKEYQETSSALGLTLSIPKTKCMVIGREVNSVTNHLYKLLMEG